MSKLFLIPTTIAESGENHIPQVVISTISGLDIFIVERLRTARRYIKKLIPEYDINIARFEELDKRSVEIPIQILQLLDSQKNIGLLSESGTPCVADPGGKIVELARHKGYQIIPLAGPNSIIMALMASGLNGQQFIFHGYLPIKENELKLRLAQLEKHINKSGYTQIFIETPYRNQSMLNFLLQYLNPHTKLCIATDITGDKENIDTLTIGTWIKEKIQLDKTPTIFLIGS